MVACRRGYADLVQLCLDYGAKNDPHPEFGQTALHACVASTQRDCAAVLLAVAAESEADDLICNLTDQNGQTPLHTSAVVGSAALAELLLSHGASLGALDAFGQTPLHLAAGASAAGAVDCLALLLVQGGDDPSLLDLPDVFGNTPLHHAAYHGRLECARLLLQSAADVSLRNAKNLTAYNLATTQGHHPLALLLLDYRDQHFVSPRKTLGSTPSHRSSRTVWSTPLQSASKQSTRATPSHQQQFSTPLTSDRHSGRHVPNGHRARTFMDAEPEDSEDAADVSQVVVAFSDRGAAGELSLRPAPRDEALLPRPHTLSHSSPSASLAKTTRAASSHSTGASGSASASSSRQSTARLDSVDVPLRRQSPLRQRVVAVASQPLVAYGEERCGEAAGGQAEGPAAAQRLGPGDDAPFELDVDPAEESEAYDYAYNDSAAAPVPPLEEFDCLDRRWAAYCTEDGFAYFLCSLPGSSEAHSQWEDPRTHGFVVAEDYYASGDAAVADGVDEAAKPFSPRGSPPRGSLSQSPSPQRQPPLSPALRSPGAQRSPASLLAALSLSRAEESKVDDEDVALALADVNEFDRTVDLDGADEAADAALGGRPSASPARPKASPVARAIDWDREASDAADRAAAPPQRQRTSRAAVLSPISSDDDSDVDRSVEVRVVAQRSRRPAKAAAPVDASGDSSGEVAALPPRSQGNKLRDQRSWMRPADEAAATAAPLALGDEAGVDLAALSPTRATLLTLDCEPRPAGGAVERAEEAAAPSQRDRAAERAQAELDRAQLVEDCAREIAARPDDLAVLQRVRRRLEEELLLPPETVKAAMARADELALAAAPADAEPAATANTAPARPDKAASRQLDLQTRLQAALADEALGKFAKMARMGVPPQSVLMKMALDKASAADQRRMQIVLGLVEEAAPAEDGDKDKMSRVIVALPEERLRRSIWAFTSDAGTTSVDGSDGANGALQEHVAEHELRELEAMFRRQQRGRPSADAAAATSADKVAQLAAQTRKTFALLLLEPRRAQNVAIGLTAFRQLSAAGGDSGAHGMLRVLQAVCALSDMDGQLTADLLDQLRVLLPSESEVKRAHLLAPPASPQHPAELFAKAALLFYPELPLRLATFVSIGAFPAQVSAAVTRLSTFVDAINVVLSSTRLAQLLQRLLVVSHRATDRRLAGAVGAARNATNYAVPGGDSQAQATLLEQLVKLSQTKAVDGRTSVLEFAVKGLYDRADGLPLVHCALRDLATLDDPQLKHGTHAELLHDCDSLESLLKRLRDEQQRLLTRRASMRPAADVAAAQTPLRDAQPQRSPSDFGSPTAQRLCDAYEPRLAAHVDALEASLERLRLQRRRLQQKTRALVDYFGEDAQTVRAPCPIFAALRDLRRDLAFAKEAVEWRLQRQQQQQQQPAHGS